MKLIYCPACHDVVALREESRTCECGLSGGKYVTGLHAEIWGRAIPIGFENLTFIGALNNRPTEGLGERFTAFVIPDKCDDVVAIKKIIEDGDEDEVLDKKVVAHIYRSAFPHEWYYDIIDWNGKPYWEAAIQPIYCSNMCRSYYGAKKSAKAMWKKIKATKEKTDDTSKTHDDKFADAAKSFGERNKEALIALANVERKDTE